VTKEKTGDKIVALQQLILPFGEETTSFSDSLTRFVRTIVAEEIRSLSSTISDQGKKIDAILSIVSSGPRFVAHHIDDASADENITVNCKPSGPLSDHEISENAGLKRHKSTTKCRGQKATSSIKKKIPTRGDFKLQRGHPWLYESHDLVNMPTSKMVFMGTELAIFAYIFGIDYDPKEILVPNGHCCESWEALMTLCLKNWVGDNQIALQQQHISVGTMEYIKTNFMGKVEDLSKISFLENILLDDWFYQSDNTERPMVSKFKFQEPEVPQQDAQSHSVIYGGVVPYR
ncbi:hypothetical protein S245_048617, partial [Arachis hypogaea]